MPTPTEVRPLENYRIWVRYSDGVEGIADLSHLAGRGVFALWNVYRQFRAVHIGPGGELAWSDEIDLCPDAIYLKVTSSPKIGTVLGKSGKKYYDSSILTS